MKQPVLSLFFAGCCTLAAIGQEPIDSYIDNPITLTVIAEASDGLNAPYDLDFHPDAKRPFELWVLNRETSYMGSTVTLYNAGTPNQKAGYLQDSYNGHFMTYPSAIAFGDNGNFATTQEILNTSGGPGTSVFMGPTLWSSDTTIYAHVNQEHNGGPLGSHLDMLHQSPFAMGVASDTGNVYWVFDGYRGNICRYDFGKPHEPGGEDHSDGKVWRYPEVTVTRKSDMPSHMVLDKKTGMLYIVDSGARRILRLNTKSGEVQRSGVQYSSGEEDLAEYKEMSQVEWSVFIDKNTGGQLSQPCGIAHADGRLLVSDNATGNILIYDITGATPKEMGRIKTQQGIMGITIGPDNRIWYANPDNNKIVRIDLAPITAIDENPISAPVALSIYPNPATDAITLTCPVAYAHASVTLADMLGTTLYSSRMQGKQEHVIYTQGLANGVYTLLLNNGVEQLAQRVLVRR